MHSTQPHRLYPHKGVHPRVVGEKLYELTDHTSATLSTGLGNVRTTITDRKIATFDSNWDITGYTADIKSANDYFPFGSEMPGRSYNSGEYRYGFIGAENDNEISGTGNSQDHTYRSYDTRLGRYKSLDPLAKSFPWNSPYAYAENRVIDGIDLEGKEWSQSTTYNIENQGFDVVYKVKVQVRHASACELSSEKQAEIMLGVKAQFGTTYTQFDKDKNINYSAELEYEFITDGSGIKEGTISILLKETTSDEENRFVGGSTMFKGGTQTNSLTVNTHVDGEMRDIKYIIRSFVHELGHSGGLSHPWEIPDDSYHEQDIKQGVAPDNVVKENIMNSGANPNLQNRNRTGSEVDATRSTTGQTRHIRETIINDKSE